MAGRTHRDEAGGAHLPPPELSRRIRLHEADEHPVRVEIEATPEEREALCRRFDLEAIEALRAEGRLERLDHGEIYRLEGTLRAAVTQLCVVTLDPIEAIVEGPFETAFVHVEEGGPEEPAEVSGDVDEEEPEPFTGDAIDVGEAIVQEFATMLDPYPRRADAVVEATFSAEEEPAAKSPFAVLEKLREPREPGGE